MSSRFQKPPGLVGVPKKVRLDQLLVMRQLAPSRSRAALLIKEGHVTVAGEVIIKPGLEVLVDIIIELSEHVFPWVSRAGVKLDYGLHHFAIDVKGMTALDVGASTGGFTDVLLSHGADKVFAVDVGLGQLHDKLLKDPRVIAFEKTNARDLSAEHITEPVDLIVCDVSFISLEKALPAALQLAKPGALLVALIKPQFEVGRAAIGKGGIVKDLDAQQAVCEKIKHWLHVDMGWDVAGITKSPILGGDGNQEFIIAAKNI